jgi:hypothetical protein
MTTELVTEALRRIEQKLDEVLKMAKAAPTATSTFSKKTVEDADLDGKYGNPEVRMVPSRWSGPDYKGWKFGDCPAEFLEEMAGMLDAIARKQAGDPAKAKFSDWSAKDAARARGWAERKRKTQPSLVDEWGGDATEVAGGDTASEGFPF